MTKIYCIQACLNLSQNDYISKRLDILYVKPLFILIQSLIPYECKVNFNQFLQSYISHIVQKFHRKISIAVCVEKKVFIGRISERFLGAPVLNKTLFALSTKCCFSSIFSTLFQFVQSFLILVFS